MVTLNKNGKPRKVGSGRTKGASSLVSVKLKDLNKAFGEDALIVCGRVFLEKAGVSVTGKAIKTPVALGLVTQI